MRGATLAEPCSSFLPLLAKRVKLQLGAAARLSFSISAFFLGSHVTFQQMKLLRSGSMTVLNETC